MTTTLVFLLYLTVLSVILTLFIRVTTRDQDNGSSFFGWLRWEYGGGKRSWRSEQAALSYTDTLDYEAKRQAAAEITSILLEELRTEQRTMRSRTPRSRRSRPGAAS
jgi:hypothetical protein